MPCAAAAGYLRHSLALMSLLCTVAAAGAQSPPPTLDPSYGLPVRSGLAGSHVRRAPDANWIWASKTTDQQAVYLRSVTRIARQPAHAALYVTADNYFTVWLNGRQVGETTPTSGGDMGWQTVHRYDVASVLRAGRNVVAIRGENAGGPAGVVVRMEVGDRAALLSDGTWRVSDGAAPDGWTGLAFDDSAWPRAREIAPVNGGAWQGALQGWPGYDADVPYLAHMSLAVVSVADAHAGAGAISGAETLTGAGAQQLQATVPAGASDPPSIVLDFGKELAGRLEVRGSGGAVLVGTGESREEAVNQPWGGVHRLELDGDRPVYTPYSAWRYAKLTFAPRDGAGDATITITKVAFDHKYYPVQYRGSFACSDPLLTRIWYTGAYTSHLCMQEDIWDAPKRDRARWMGDLHVSGEVIDDVFADRFLMEQTMQRLRDDAQGGHPAAELPAGHVNGIPGYSCAWICGLADFHRHIGDYEYLHKQHDLLVSMLEYFRGELDDRGLFANRRRAWPFVDWSPDFDADGPLARAATHLFFVKAMREAVFLFREMGDTANAVKYTAWADQLQDAARKLLADPDAHTYGSRRQENAMAIYSGVATPDEVGTIYDTILKPGSPAWDQVATPYYNNYVIYAMSMAGHTAETLGVLRDYWGGMLAEGATSFWEGYDPRWEKDNFHAHLQADDGTGYFVSLCHGWSSGATSWLTERVLGVRPTSGGFRTAEIEPELGDLAWAEGRVPTPHGDIAVRAERKTDGGATGISLRIDIPRGVEATVILRGETAMVNGRTAAVEPAGPGRVRVHVSHAGRYLVSGA